MTLLLALVQATETPGWPSGGGMSVLRGFVALAVVFGTLALLVWGLRRSGFGTAARRRSGGIAVETAVALGDRRSLVVVSVEGRRLLLGLTPMHVSLVTELQAPAPFSDALEQAAGQGNRS